MPSTFITELAASTDITLLPIDGAALEALRVSDGFYTASSVAAEAYKCISPINTLAVGAQWYTSGDANTDLIYTLTKRLFSPAALAQVKASYQVAAQVSPANGVLGARMPLHPGAEKFYREIGVIK